MALTTSTIVMAVLTCVPFGLAIKDTVSGKPTAQRDRDSWEADRHDDDGDSAYDAEYARAEAAREAAEPEDERLEALKDEKRAAARRTLFGAEVATLGSGFSGIKLGMPAADMRTDVASALEASIGMKVALLANGTLDRITVQAEHRSDEEDDTYSMCLKLRQEIQAAWGTGVTEDYETRYWINPTTGTRASLRPDNCVLSFERYAAPKEWITKTPTSLVPVAVVGQSIKKLAEHIGTRSEIDPEETSVRWLGLGVGAGTGEARFEAFYVKGKVVALVTTVDALEATREEVRDQLTALYGKPVEDDEGDYRWKRPAITLDDYEGAGIRVTVGTVPTEE